MCPVTLRLVYVSYPSSCSPNEFALVLSRMNITSVTTMTANPFSDATQSVIIQLTSTGNFPTFCPQTDMEYDTTALILIVVIRILVGLVILETFLDWYQNLFFLMWWRRVL